jgi:hypothetical protein
MKGRVVFLFAALALIVLLGFAGCGLLSVTIEQRISQFVEALNAADRSQVYTNFSSMDTQDYDSIKSATYWDIPFPAGTTGDPLYSVTSTIDPSDPMSVYVTIDGPPDFFGPKNYMFVMVNDSVGMENWKVHELWIWDGSTAFVPLIQ